MTRGELIRKYRKLKHLTQAELGKKVGLGESAIRNYELDLRDPSPETVKTLAKALGISVEALDGYQLNSARDGLEALFRLNEAFGLEPDSDGRLVIDPKASQAKKLNAALKAWRSMLDKLDAGDIDPDEYELWKASFKS